MQDLGSGAADNGQPTDHGGEDSDSDGDTDSWPPLEEIEGGLQDPITGLIWQNPALFDLLHWMEANVYCGDLELGGKTDWHLPSVDQLQSLLRGCTGAEACGVEDTTCLETECNTGPNCDGCIEGGGPGDEGCFWDPALAGWCETYWSESPTLPGYYRYWTVDFIFAKTRFDDQAIANAVRCVRDPE